MSFTTSDIKKLREQTGAGMMACKKALAESQGNFDLAVDYLRKKGLAAAQKKQTRVAAEGMVVSLVEGKIGVLVEVNCETDFVSRGDDFSKFANDVARFILKERPVDIEALASLKQDEANELTLKIGEKIAIRRFQVVEAESVLGVYNHGGRIGVLVNVKSNADGQSIELQELIKDLAMHVAAADPKFLSGDDINENFKQKEAEVYAAQLKEEGKPEKIIGKIVEGKLRKLATEVCCLEQKFVKNSDINVKQLLEAFGQETSLLGFHKFNLGEGIEKKEDSLAEEVAKMTKQKQ